MMLHNSGSSRVLLMEPHAQGHHGPYLQWMTEELIDQGFNVTLRILSESFSHPSIQHISNTFSDDVHIVSSDDQPHILNDSDGAIGLIKREFAYWRLFQKWYQEQAKIERPEFVFLPYLDYCLYAIGLLGSPFGKTPWAGIAMRPSFHYHDMKIKAPRPSLEKFKKILFLRLLDSATLKCLLTIDKPLFEYLKRNKSRFEKVNFLPEPSENISIYSSKIAKTKLGLNSDRKVILVYGALDSRKGIRDLLLAIKNKKCQFKLDILLAGKISDDIQNLLNEAWVQSQLCECKLIILNRFITVEYERILFSAADMVWLGYRGHYTGSGVLVQAARSGIPVIASEEGIIGWQVKSNNLGVIVELDNVDSIISGIRKLIEDDDMRQICGANGQHIFKMHSFEEAKAILTRAIADS